MSESIVDAALTELGELQHQLVALLQRVETTFKKLRDAPAHAAAPAARGAWTPGSERGRPSEPGRAPKPAGDIAGAARAEELAARLLGLSGEDGRGGAPSAPPVADRHTPRRHTLDSEGVRSTREPSQGVADAEVAKGGGASRSRSVNLGQGGTGDILDLMRAKSVNFDTGPGTGGGGGGAGGGGAGGALFVPSRGPSRRGSMHDVLTETLGQIQKSAAAPQRVGSAKHCPSSTAGSALPRSNSMYMKDDKDGCSAVPAFVPSAVLELPLGAAVSVTPQSRRGSFAPMTTPDPISTPWHPTPDGGMEQASPTSEDARRLSGATLHDDEGGEGNKSGEGEGDEETGELPQFRDAGIDGTVKRRGLTNDLRRARKTTVKKIQKSFRGILHPTRFFTPRFNAGGSILSLRRKQDMQSLNSLNGSRNLDSNDSISKIKFKLLNGIHPRSSAAAVWDSCMAGTYCFVIWFVPISTCFEANQHLQRYISYFSSWMYALDIVKILLTRKIQTEKPWLRPKAKIHPGSGGNGGGNTAQGTSGTKENDSAFNGEMVQEMEVLLPLRTSVISYLTTTFVMDFMAMLPWDQLLSNSLNMPWLLMFIKLTRLWRLPVLVHKSPHFMHLKKLIEIQVGGGRLLWNLGVLFASFLVFLHMEGCLFYLIGRLTNFTFSPLNSRNGTVLEQYIEGLFYAVSNTVPVAYKPTDPPHQVVVFTLALAGALFVASITASVTSFSNSTDASSKIYRQKLDELNDYMDWKRLPPDIRDKVRHYYALKYRGKFFEEHSLLDTLNQSLRNQIAMHNCRQLIDQVPFLRRDIDDGRTESFIGRIAKAMVACFFVKGDVICTEGEMGMEMFFIVSGRVHVIVNRRKCATLKNGQFFGELSMVAMIPRTATVVAGSPSVLYKLSRSDFLPILNDFEDVKSKIADVYKQRIERLKKEEEERMAEASVMFEDEPEEDLNLPAPPLGQTPVILMASAQLEPSRLFSNESIYPGATPGPLSHAVSMQGLPRPPLEPMTAPPARGHTLAVPPTSEAAAQPSLTAENRSTNLLPAAGATAARSTAALHSVPRASAQAEAMALKLFSNEDLSSGAPQRPVAPRAPRASERAEAMAVHLFSNEELYMSGGMRGMQFSQQESDMTTRRRQPSTQRSQGHRQ
ncbi:anaphase-promoting complex subunit Hcn1 [Phlyctochytrium bullatum]|nr:anaphase-promoting complex subunit Hcn1 [Phlyctochytrium bullatum]